MKHVPRVLAIMGAVLSLAAVPATAADSASVAARKLDAAEAAFASNGAERIVPASASAFRVFIVISWLLDDV